MSFDDIISEHFDPETNGFLRHLGACVICAAAAEDRNTRLAAFDDMSAVEALTSPAYGQVAAWVGLCPEGDMLINASVDAFLAKCDARLEERLS